MRIIRELVFNGYIADTEHVTLDVTDPTRARQRPITTAPPATTAPETEETAEDGETAGEAADTTETA